MNAGYTYRSQVGPAEAARSLLEHLTSAYPHSSADVWAARLAGGEITLDQAMANGSETLRVGQHIVWRRPPWHEPDVPRTFAVVHDDAALLVVAKPSGLPTMPAGGFLEHTLWTLVRRAHGDVHPVHRLGRFTSGLVVFARTADAARTLGAGWHARVVKTYRALVTGAPPWTTQAITVPIGPVPHPRLGRVYAASPSGRSASSVVDLIERRTDATLCEVTIHTGRPHQIRIHLAAAGFPLVGDPLYAVGGTPLVDTPGLPGDGGYWLHAHRLTLPHPVTGEKKSLGAEPPPILRARQGS